MREDIKIKRQIFRREFGERIKNLRDLNGINRKDMAEYIGVCDSTLANWESGKSSPKINKLIKISNKFNVSIDYLIGLENKKPR